MPLPKPHTGETRSDFVSRCMADPATKEMQGTQEQKVAACESQFDGKGSEETGGVEMKSFGGIEIKDAATGQIEAVIATLGIKDRDGDWIPTAAIEAGAPATISMYDHDSIRNLMTGSGLSDAPPVGKGAIFIEGEKAIFRVSISWTPNAGVRHS